MWGSLISNCWVIAQNLIKILRGIGEKCCTGEAGLAIKKNNQKFEHTLCLEVPYHISETIVVISKNPHDLQDFIRLDWIYFTG